MTTLKLKKTILMNILKWSFEIFHKIYEIFKSEIFTAHLYSTRTKSVQRETGQIS